MNAGSIIPWLFGALGKLVEELIKNSKKVKK